MGTMTKRFWAVAVGVAWIWLLTAAWAADSTAALSFLVLKDDNGKPVRNAAVVLHPVNPHGKQGRGGFELKTDSDGKTHFEGVPYGKMRVQVLAEGFQTFGEDYDIGEPSKEITVKLKRPQKQYSIYEDRQGTPKKDPPAENKDPGASQKPPMISRGNSGRSDSELPK
jgi:hypothetical protein